MCGTAIGAQIDPFALNTELIAALGERDETSGRRY
jgi:hypothetical protein